MAPTSVPAGACGEPAQAQVSHRGRAHQAAGPSSLEAPCALPGSPSLGAGATGAVEGVPGEGSRVSHTYTASVTALWTHVLGVPRIVQNLNLFTESEAGRAGAAHWCDPFSVSRSACSAWCL